VRFKNKKKVLTANINKNIYYLKKNIFSKFQMIENERMIIIEIHQIGIETVKN
jgi:hypothetical protein